MKLRARGHCVRQVDHTRTGQIENLSTLLWITSGAVARSSLIVDLTPDQFEDLIQSASSTNMGYAWTDSVSSFVVLICLGFIGD